MNDDLLSQATRALREETEADDASARFTRARVMASLHQSRVTRRKRLAIVIPVATSFAMATAYAAASGKLPRMLTTIVHALGAAKDDAPAPASKTSAQQHAPRSAVPRRAAPIQSARPTPPPPEIDTPIDAPPEVDSVPPAASSSRRVTPARRAATPPVAPADLPDESDPGFELYRTAHHAHFVEHDPARALGAWNAYLAATPTGRFALEARYNRALCLVRLGRLSEAATALEPFAQGKFGGYRQGEARDLLRALADAGPSVEP